MNIICKSLEDLQRRKILLNNLVHTFTEEYSKIKKMGCEGHRDLKAIDTSQEIVQATSKLKFEDALLRLREIEQHLFLLQEDLKIIDNGIKGIEDNVKQLDGLEEKIYYCRKVKGFTQERTAKELGLSVRHLRRIEKKIKDVLSLTD